jgi:hypothetical protein
MPIVNKLLIARLKSRAYDTMGKTPKIVILGMALTWAILSLTEFTENAEKNQKNSVISAGSAR